ncbi:hypothetical protein BDZ89DRAFT_1160058 [Hymenopellis radicata]|nr:hypothetical protein BDZ89DRAFT_1160058 [Hymenopellis radicata]
MAGSPDISTPQVHETILNPSYEDLLLERDHMKEEKKNLRQKLAYTTKQLKTMTDIITKSTILYVARGSFWKSRPRKTPMRI